MILTFTAETFNGPRLEERLNDLIYQDIFLPQGMIIDGYDFERATVDEVRDLLDLIQAMSLTTWFSAVRHRKNDRVSALGVPAPCDAFEEFFNTVLLLDPAGDSMVLRTIKDDIAQSPRRRELVLDPTTLFLRET